jgi:hypothetical protein
LGAEGRLAIGGEGRLALGGEEDKMKCLVWVTSPAAVRGVHA